jgi:hypothetical protein
LFGGCLQLQGIPVQTGQQAATLRDITISGDDHDLAVQITATAHLTPRIEIATDPDRLIVDLPEALPRAGLDKILVNRRKLRDIRIGLLSANPRITRVVLDLSPPITPYRLLPMGNTLVVKLGDDSGAGPAPRAATAKLQVDTKSAASSSMDATNLPAQSPIPPHPQSPEPSRTRWTLPILVTTTVLAMLIIALVAHIQNKRGRRGL